MHDTLNCFQLFQSFWRFARFCFWDASKGDIVGTQVFLGEEKKGVLQAPRDETVYFLCPISLFLFTITFFCFFVFCFTFFICICSITHYIHSFIKIVTIITFINNPCNINIEHKMK